jgi:hypothetical protein
VSVQDAGEAACICGRDAQFSLTYGRMCLVSQMRSLSILISKASEAFDKHSLLRGSDE